MTMSDDSNSRRDFLDSAIATTTVALVGTALYPIVRYLNAPPSEGPGAIEVAVGKAGDLAPATAIAFRFGNKPALLVKDDLGKLRAFVAICTHLSCVVQFKKDLGHIWCACHNGHFDLLGRNIQGPPPRPLEELAVELRGEDVVVKGA
jgi:cytochrome b6-f complex iron-sulfur subunit